MIWAQDSPADAADTFCQWTSNWVGTCPTLTPRAKHTATLLQNGQVLIAGGLELAPGKGPHLQPYSIVLSELYDPIAQTSTPTGSMELPRSGHTATLLNNGKVLIYGDINGGSFYAELYDPASGTFSLTNSTTAIRRGGHTATVLQSGRVLVTGGWNEAYCYALSTAEIYDPDSGTFTSTTGPMQTARAEHTATLLGDGKVLITGGESDNDVCGSSDALATAELYDPATDKFTVIAAALSTKRAYHTATMLPSGKVLIAGGKNLSGQLASSDIYDPGANTFTPGSAMPNPWAGHTATLLTNENVLLVNGTTALSYDSIKEMFTSAGSLKASRTNHTATLLDDGTVLVSGGGPYSGPYLSSQEIYDPLWIGVGPMEYDRFDHSSTLLQDGSVLVVGGTSAAGPNHLACASPPCVTSSAELFYPDTLKFASTGMMTYDRANHTATPLENGNVLIAGGKHNANGQHSSAELYDPATGSFLDTGWMKTARYWHTATLLNGGKVLISGGYCKGCANTVLQSAEIYDPSAIDPGTGRTGAFSVEAQMQIARYGHDATLMPDGEVLISGGFNSAGGIENSREIYDPAQNTFTLVTQPQGNLLTGRANFTGTLLDNGNVLIAGGLTSGSVPVPTKSAELCDETACWYTTGHGGGRVGMAVSRSYHTATKTDLPLGQAMIVGGQANSMGLVTASVDLYDQSYGFYATQPLAAARSNHATTLLLDGRVLVTGGMSAGNRAEMSKSTQCAPVIETIAPLAASVGEQVTISGYKFGFPETADSRVSFNGVGAGQAISWSKTEIVVAVPARASTGPVVVTVDGVSSNPMNFTVKTDLVISSLTCNAFLVKQGQSIIVSEATQNRGTALAGPTVTNYYWSTKSTYDNTAVLLGQRSVPALASGAISGPKSTPVTVPPNAQNGAYYIIALANAENTIVETDYTNNTRAVAVGIGPDLVVSAFTIPATARAGETIKGSYTVKNVGNDPADQSTIGFYWSKKRVLDITATTLPNGTVPQLSPGAAFSGTITVPLPLLLQPGTYYVFAKADADNAVVEASEANNIRVRVITVSK